MKRWNHAAGFVGPSWTRVVARVWVLPDWPIRGRHLGRLPRYARLRVHASNKYVLVINRAVTV
jgi:hypothetical protein